MSYRLDQNMAHAVKLEHAKPRQFHKMVQLLSVLSNFLKSVPTAIVEQHVLKKRHMIWQPPLPNHMAIYNPEAYPFQTTPNTPSHFRMRFNS